MKRQSVGVIVFAILIGMTGCRSILIKTDPTGAKISCDNESLGVTPASVQVSMMGSKAITLQKEGYNDERFLLTYNSLNPIMRTLTAEGDTGGDEINRLTKEVNRFVAHHEYEKARELIWRFTKHFDNKELDARMKETRTKLMTEIVNVKQWRELEAQILEKVRPLMKDEKYAEVRAYLDTVHPIRTYTVLFDERVDAVGKTVRGMGVPMADVEPVCKATREMIEQAFLSLGETYNQSASQTNPDCSAYEKAVQNMKDTLITYECKPEDADKIVETLRADMRVLIEKYCVAEATSSSLVSLGTVQFNIKLAELKKKILTQVTEKEWINEQWERLIKLVKDKENEERLAGLREALARQDAEPIVQELITCVRGCLAKEDWDGARAIIRNLPRVGKDDVDMMVFAVRVGLLNSEVNPAQCQATLAFMDKTCEAFVQNGQLAECETWFREYSPAVKDDYTKIVESLKNVAQTMTALGMNGEVTQANVTRVQNSLQAYLDKRAGAYRDKIESEDFWEFEVALASLEVSIIDQTMNAPLAKQYAAAILTLVKEWSQAEATALTTYEMNQQLLARFEELKHTTGYKVLLGLMDREVNFNTQIALAENGLRCGAQDFHPVLGEYARIFRLMKLGKELSAEQKQTLLVGGAYLNQFGIVTWAQKLGALIDLPSPRDALARSALLIATQNGHLQLIRSLVDSGASIMATDAQGNTFLHYTARLGNLDLLKVALKANNVNAQNAQGQTALFTSARQNHLEQIKELLAASADATIQDKSGLTAFDMACDESCMGVFDVLLKAGAPLSESAFCRAARRDDLAVVRWFVEQGVDVNAPGVMSAAAEARDIDKKTATYNYLVRQGGVAVPLPVKVEKAAPSKKCCVCQEKEV